MEIRQYKLIDVPTSSLAFDPENPHDPTIQEDAGLEYGMLKFGNLVPIVVDQNFLVIDGHRRAKMYVRRKLPDIPAYQVQVSDEIERRLLRQFLNDSTSKNDPERYAKELKTIFEGGKLDELARMLAKKRQELLHIIEKSKLVPSDSGKFGFNGLNPDDDTGWLAEVTAAKQAGPTMCNPGEIWQLGEHRLMCGDSTDRIAVDSLFHVDGYGAVRASMTFTSPPYNIGANTGGASKYRADADENPDYLKLLVDFTTEALLHSDFCFVNLQMLGSNKRDVIKYLGHFQDHFVDVVVWDKGNAIPAISKNVLSSQFEFVFIFSAEKHPARTITSGYEFQSMLSNVYHGESQHRNAFAAVHRATFPVHLPMYFVTHFSKIGDAVFEPFSGTGSTIIACQKQSRRCFAVDKDPVYCDIAVKRWEKLTGLKAKRLIKPEAK